MKELITKAGKKAYTLVMGRPNPAKLANFPECEVFINVSCAQTALLDGKEFLAPVITPFEAMLAFSRGTQWTGAYVMEFRDLMSSSPVEARDQTEEARFSFLQKVDIWKMWASKKMGRKRQKRLCNCAREILILLSREQLNLELSISSVDLIMVWKCMPEPYAIGRSGKASGYADEKTF